MLSRNRVMELLSYNPETGVFIWKKGRGGFAKSGSVAGSLDSKGYRQIKIDGRLYLAHRLAWLVCNGVMPDGHLDHADRNPKNNAISNLRLCSQKENQQNVGIRSDNTSGVTGVSLHPRSGKWIAYINTNGRRTRIGQFESKCDAVQARIAAKKRLHIFHPEQAQ
jgi:hypothetical protein